MKTKMLFTSLFLFSFFFHTLNAQTYRVAVSSKDPAKSGYVDLNGELIFQASYYYYYPYTTEGTALVASKRMNKFNLFDKMGNEIIPEIKIKIYVDTWVMPVKPHVYNDGMLKVTLNGKWGGLNSKGKLTVQPVYDRLTDFYDGYALGERDKVFYVVYKNGRETLIENNEAITYIKHFSDGLAPIETNGKRFGFVDTLGKIVIAPQFITVGYFSGGYAWARTKNKKIGYINKNGDWIINPRLAVANNFDVESGLAMIQARSDDSHWLYIDTTGKVRSFSLADKNYRFSEGLAIGRKDKKVGYLNTKGEWAIEPQFDIARHFINGYAAVKVKGLWGLINKAGDWILQPEYKFVGDVAVIK